MENKTLKARVRTTTCFYIEKRKLVMDHGLASATRDMSALRPIS